MLPLADERHVLLTEYVEPSPPFRPGVLLAWCAGLLERLALRSAENLPVGGAARRHSAGEINEALALGGQLGASVAEVVDALAKADDGTGLPEALIYADLTPPNAVPQGEQPRRSSTGSGRAVVRGSGRCHPC